MIVICFFVGFLIGWILSRAFMWEHIEHQTYKHPTKKDYYIIRFSNAFRIKTFSFKYENFEVKNIRDVYRDIPVVRNEFWRRKIIDNFYRNHIYEDLKVKELTLEQFISHLEHCWKPH